MRTRPRRGGRNPPLDVSRDRVAFKSSVNGTNQRDARGRA